MDKKFFLVGDNPFHSISHLSQERSRARSDFATQPESAARLVSLAVENGANGFMFSVSDTTLGILRKLRIEGVTSGLDIFAIVPYAYEYVRLAAQSGGLVGLGQRFGKQLLLSGNLGAVGGGLKGVLRMNPESLLRTYLSFELSRIRSAAGKHANVESVLLHEVITDMALALDMDWLFKAYVKFLRGKDIVPGFNTCNFACLADKFERWGFELGEVVIAAPFNKVGFQMNPSREECEKALSKLKVSVTIAISVLAAGYLKVPEAVDYVAGLPNVKGLAVGVSKEAHARDTFRFIRERFDSARALG
ncbi:MAG: hypothetical protein ABSB89_00890 [Candidatus Bathyarchaeia archaeon]|jgi:hypothetical protein